MATFDEAPVVELGVGPIEGDEPCGTDAAEEVEYIAVFAEFEKVDRVEADEPDWHRIEQDCTTLLQSKSKDLEVAVALGHALFNRHGYAGLAAALALLDGLISNFWEGLYPARPRRRKARIETLTDRLSEGGWFRENQPQPDEFDAIDLCVTRAADLKASLTEKMPDDPPEVRKFEQGLKELASRRPKPAEAAAPAAAPAAVAGAAFAGGEIADVGGAVKALLTAATFIRKADPTDPIPYGVVRLVRWAKVSLPTSDAGKHEIPPPEATRVEALAHQYGNQMWDHLLAGAEGAFRSDDPLWLDLQRYVCAAMGGLGAPYDKARQAVMNETAGLVRRLGGGLYELRFKGGMPLCSGDTRMWIESEVAPRESGGGGGEADDGALAEATDKARKLAGGGKLKEALTELQSGLAACSQRRDRLRWRLSIARLCVDAGRLALALPLLEECREDIQRYEIAEWEPTLAVNVAQTLYKCRKAVVGAQKEPAPEARESVRDSFAWLCQLDPLAALDAEPSGK